MGNGATGDFVEQLVWRFGNGRPVRSSHAGQAVTRMGMKTWEFPEDLQRFRKGCECQYEAATFKLLSDFCSALFDSQRVELFLS